MNTLKTWLLLSVALLLTTVDLFGQPTSGTSYPIVERATYSSAAPCGVCSPWQYVQADSTLRRYIGTNWITYVNPNSVVGSVNFSYDNLTSGDLTVSVYRTGSTATTLTTNATGDYTVVVPTGTKVMEMFIHGNSNTLNGGSFIFRIDGSADTKDYRMSTQMYNTSNGALVNVFTQGNNHTRTISTNVVTDTYPNMSPYSTTGFDILYK